MTMSSKGVLMAVKQRRNVGYGLSQPLVNVFPVPIVADRDPAGNDRAEPGTIWVNKLTDDVFVSASTTANVTDWTSIAGGAGEFDQLTVAGAGPVDIDVTGAVSIDSDAASNFSVAGAGVDLTLASAAGRVVVDGGEAAANAVTIDASAVAGGIDIDSGTGGITVDSTGLIAIDSALAAINAITIDASNAAGGIDVDSGTGGHTIDSQGLIAIDSALAAASAITIRASAADGDVIVRAGGQIDFITDTVDGFINPNALEVTTAGAAGTLNTFMGVATQTGLTTASGATEVITITCNQIAITSGVFVSASNFGGNDAQMTVTRVIPAAGSFTVTLTNNGAAALNGDLVLTFWVVS